MMSSLEHWIKERDFYLNSNMPPGIKKWAKEHYNQIINKQIEIDNDTSILDLLNMIEKSGTDEVVIYNHKQYRKVQKIIGPDSLTGDDEYWFILTDFNDNFFLIKNTKKDGFKYIKTC